VPARAAPPAPIFNWTGFYAGGNAGEGSGSGTLSGLPNDFTTGISTPIDFRSHGFLGGVEFGYNWQWMPNWVVGFEGDFAAANLRANGGFAFFINPAFFVTGPAEQKIDFFSTARARVGYLVNNNVLLYGTGGFAWAREKLRTSGTTFIIFTPFPFGPTSDVRTVDGWTVGGGIEWALAPNWSAKLEYLHLDFGSRNFTVNPAITASAVRVSSQVDVVRLGLNYRFGNP
jgi:outer membrane immunogenic protein